SLFQPLEAQLKLAKIRSKPTFPGTLLTSREWGHETERQRWMWSTMYDPDNMGLGTIVIKFFHDHTTFCIPRMAEILALHVIEPDQIIATLSCLSSDFADAHA